MKLIFSLEGSGKKLHAVAENNTVSTARMNANSVENLNNELKDNDRHAELRRTVEVILTFTLLFLTTSDLFKLSCDPLLI